ncbi:MULTISPECIES: hypothetical protein [Sphingobium]|uniref:hypothetical protein n=1 Tax=Sphingobium TaxID=165695 RepID=UPI000361F84F|nr:MULTISPECIES: hypothetical protein [Sphingobium]ETI62745.1 hypothetical protein C100_16225 [Sphingobium sp. C100]HUD93256.1 hypothetical protein [Sphingobium sp.]
MGTIGADIPGCTLDISEHLFRLTTESLRLRSNETKSYQTLERLLEARIGSLSRIRDRDMTTLKEHLVAIPTQGEIRIELQISQTSADCLDDVKDLLSRELDADLTVGDALSVLLFDYVVEQKAARVLAKMDLERVIPARIAIPPSSPRH